jgi:hypothetical protein
MNLDNFFKQSQKYKKNITWENNILILSGVNIKPRNSVVNNFWL